MHLIIEIDTAHKPGGPAAAGLVIVDSAAARSIHKAGRVLPDRSHPLMASYATLLQALELVGALSPEQVEIRCTAGQLVEEITSPLAQPSAEAEPLHAQIVARLLKIDSWSITAREPGHSKRALSLAREAIEKGGDVQSITIAEAPSRQSREHTGVPQWTVELLDDPGDQCPARCTPGTRYPFGPDTPAGFCVYATSVVLLDGPLSWADRNQKRMTTFCPHCNAAVRLDVVG